MNSFLLCHAFLFFGCLARSAVGDTNQDEVCLLADLKKGVCRSYEQCPTAVLSVQKQISVQRCPIERSLQPNRQTLDLQSVPKTHLELRYPGFRLWGAFQSGTLSIQMLRHLKDTPWYVPNLYIGECFRISSAKEEIQQQRTKPIDRLDRHSNLLGDLCCELDPGPGSDTENQDRSPETEDYDPKILDEETERFYYSRRRNNGYFGRRQTENYINSNTNYYNRKPDDPRSNSYYNRRNSNRAPYQPYNDNSNSFVFPGQGPGSSSNHQNGNNYQGNANNFGGVWHTTQKSPGHNYWTKRPEPMTLGPLLPTYKPSPNTNGPYPYNEWNRKRISERKCEEYFERIVPVASGLPLVLNPKPINNNPQLCVAPQQLIVGGQATTRGEFPHMALIYFPTKEGDKGLCGGSLISDRYVLTAAHCIESGGIPKKVLLGGYNTDATHIDGKFYTVAQIIIHPDRRPPVRYNDIALLRLSQRVELTYKIRPACLYTKFSLPVRKVVALGWGRVSFAGEASKTLLKVSLDVHDSNFCSEVYKNHGHSLPQKIIDSQICAGDIKGAKDTCTGDSGGPIEIVGEKNNCNHFVVGITSFGKACGVKNSTAVYTRIYSYIDWIEGIVWPE